MLWQFKTTCHLQVRISGLKLIETTIILSVIMYIKTWFGVCIIICGLINDAVDSSVYRA